MRIDPTDAGVHERWWDPGNNLNNWSRTSVGCPGGCSSAALQAWSASHNGTAYGGVSWWRVSSLCNPTCCAPLLGDNVTRLYLKNSGGATKMTAWLNGVEIGGCAGAGECSRAIVLQLPTKTPASLMSGTSEGRDTLVLMVNATANSTGKLPRVFTVQ
jgi:hypothetical protein